MILNASNLVEKIIRKRKIQGSVEYLLQWNGFDNPTSNSWEPAKNLSVRA